MTNPMDLSGRRYLVTGASSGIGRATAELLAQLGARVVLSGRDEQRLAEAAAGMEGDGHCIEPYDLQDVNGVEGWLRKVATAGSLNGLVHSAGAAETMPLRYLRLENLDSIFHLNVTAGVALTKGFRKPGVCAPNGSVVLISSVAGLVGFPAFSAYSASKGALIAAVRSLSVDLASDKIRINCVAPGQVAETGMHEAFKRGTPEREQVLEAKHPLGFGRPLDVAHSIAFLLSDAARWITGTALVVDGGCSAAR